MFEVSGLTVPLTSQCYLYCNYTMFEVSGLTVPLTSQCYLYSNYLLGVFINVIQLHVLFTLNLCIKASLLYFSMCTTRRRHPSCITLCLLRGNGLPPVHEAADHVYGQREDDGRVLLRGDALQGLQVPG